MLSWSPGAIKATMGVGALGLMVLLSELLNDMKLAQPFALVFPLAFAPAFVFMMFGHIHDRPWARKLQVVALAWYAGVTLMAVSGAVQRGLPRHDLFFLCFVALGAWPCTIAARALRRRARGRAPEADVVIDAAFEPGEHPVVLQGVRRKWMFVLVVMAIFLAIGLTPSYQRERPFIAWATVVFCGLGIVFALAQLLVPAARSTLMLDARGFEVRTLGRRSRTAWTDVAGFGLVRISNATMIGIAYAPHYTRQRVARAIAATLGDAEGAIPDNFEVSGMALAALLERWRERFGQPQSETFTQS